MQTNFDDVGNFHEKFNLPNVTHNGVGDTGHSTNTTLIDFRTKFMQEELDEFTKGYEESDVAQMADALVDLVYVALGTAHLLGLPWQALWQDVQRANMTKERAAEDGSNSKRGSSLDVVKPEGWVGPRTAEVLKQNGF